MIVAIRIAGMVGIPDTVERILFNLRLRKKYSCILVKNKKLIELVKDKVTYGEITHDTLKMLISKRGKKLGDKPISESADIVIKKLEEGKSLADQGIKPFFRMHPPIGGFKKSTKMLPPKGMLGENKKMDELVRKML